jgi:hypothetical protein
VVAETAKVIAEMAKVIAEMAKVTPEATKVIAEAGKVISDEKSGIALTITGNDLSGCSLYLKGNQTNEK